MPGKVTGTIEDFSFAEIIQTLSLGMKTARASFTHGRDTGRLWIVDGQPKHASTGRHEGEEAVYEMIRWTSGEFVIEPGLTSDRTTLTRDTTFLLMEGLKRMDEEAAAAANAPSAPPAPERSQRIAWVSAAALAVVAIAAVGAIAALQLREAPVVASPVDPTASKMAEVPYLPDPFSVAAAPTVETTDLEGDFLFQMALAAAQPPAEPPPPPDDTPVLAAEETPSMPKEAVPAEPEGVTVMDLSVFDPAALADPQAPEAVPAAAAEPVEPPPHAPPGSYLEIQTKSLVKRGTLRLFLDGEVVLTRRLSSEAAGTKRFFKRIVGQVAEKFDTIVELPAGAYELLAQVDLDDDSYGYEGRILVDLPPGTKSSVRLVAGRTVGRPLSLKLEGTTPVPAGDASPPPGGTPEIPSDPVAVSPVAAPVPDTAEDAVPPPSLPSPDGGPGADPKSPVL